MDGTISEIRMFAGNFPPSSWAFCDGSLQSIAQNTALFSLIGTTYGGDGQQTFALPVTIPATEVLVTVIVAGKEFAGSQVPVCTTALYWVVCVRLV